MIPILEMRLPRLSEFVVFLPRRNLNPGSTFFCDTVFSPFGIDSRWPLTSVGNEPNNERTSQLQSYRHPFLAIAYKHFPFENIKLVLNRRALFKNSVKLLCVLSDSNTLNSLLD